MRLNPEIVQRIEGPLKDLIVRQAEALAKVAAESGAATGSVTFQWLRDDDGLTDGEFVPEFTIRVRRYPFEH